jgi:flavin reductase (DIM6/NTAB) family NADH-FMN oxidoreductase RutF
MSVSLDPPLVGFLPMRSSASWGRIAPVGQFCVNVLSEDQAPLCRALASRDRDALLSARFELSPLGSPILSGVVAWIDCTIHSVQDAGDHYMVLGRVHNLGSGEGGSALIFCNGSYGVFGDSAAGNVSIANR